ncbi:MAG: peptidylprolyl isomerase [Pseudomonadota bacterium]
MNETATAKPKDAAQHHLHLSIAEQGKIHAVEGNHPEALRHYREALRMAVAAGAPEVFFRHYTQCVMESLELLGSYDEVDEFLARADAHYREANVQLSIQRRDHGSILEQRGALALKRGDAAAAKEHLSEAVEIAGKGALPLADELNGWLARGYAVDAGRVTESQRRHGTFVVRADKINRAIARPLPRAAVDPAAALRA